MNVELFFPPFFKQKQPKCFNVKKWRALKRQCHEGLASKYCLHIRACTSRMAEQHGCIGASVRDVSHPSVSEAEAGRNKKTTRSALPSWWWPSCRSRISKLLASESSVLASKWPRFRAGCCEPSLSLLFVSSGPSLSFGPMCVRPT